MAATTPEAGDFCLRRVLAQIHADVTDVSPMLTFEKQGKTHIKICITKAKALPHPQQSVRELFFRWGQRSPLAMNLKQVLPKALNADRIRYQGLGPLWGTHQVREHTLFQGRKPVQPDEFCHRAGRYEWSHSGYAPLGIVLAIVLSIYTYIKWQTCTCFPIFDPAHFITHQVSEQLLTCE
ncbi:hypothetical protein [Pseudomonas sp. Leaf58]|uniref:hypothetical protein n=1 Tax=Pseudomonas sp. Leaf58 TaxID=1736226 RepID=UPI0012E73FBA|nr:hypothetical protein [Pseudomonas sp. Leaf58]